MYRYLCLKMSHNVPARLLMETSLFEYLLCRSFISCQLFTWRNGAHRGNNNFENNKIYLLATKKWARVVSFDREFSIEWEHNNRFACNINQSVGTTLSSNFEHWSKSVEISVKHVLPDDPRAPVLISVVTQSLLFEAKDKGHENTFTGDRKTPLKKLVISLWVAIWNITNWRACSWDQLNIFP